MTTEMATDSEDLARFCRAFGWVRQRQGILAVSDEVDWEGLARLLRATGDDLSAFGRRLWPWSPARSASWDSRPLFARCVDLLARSDRAQPEEALTLFAASMHLARGHGHESRPMRLIEACFLQPAWRTQAVLRFADFFRAARPKGRPTETALHALARTKSDGCSISSHTDDVRATLAALRHIGLESTQDARGRTPAFVACCGRNRHLARAFLDHADLASVESMRDALGRPVLHCVLQEGDCASHVRWLLDMGANPRARDRQGQSVLDVAVTCSRPNVLRTLLATQAYDRAQLMLARRRASSADMVAALDAALARQEMRRLDLDDDVIALDPHAGPASLRR